MAGFGGFVGDREVSRAWIMKSVYAMLMNLDLIVRALGSC